MNYLRHLWKHVSGVLMIPFLAAAFVARRLIKIEICVVGSQRFGHLALEPEVHLSLKSLSRVALLPRSLTLWSFGQPRIHSNHTLVRLWQREIGLSLGWIVGPLIRAGEICPSLAIQRASLSIHGPQNVLDITTSRLADQTRSLKSNVLSNLGLKTGAYVCLVVRDRSYYQQTGLTESAGYELLNFDVQVFREACARLVADGFKVVRLGTPTPYHAPEIDGVIDYANSLARCEVNDLVLVRDCAFLVSTQTGPDALGLALRKPVLYIDTLRLSQFFFGTQLVSWNPVRFVCPHDEQPLSLKQLLDSPFCWMKDPDQFLKSGFSFERSSSHDIAEIVSSYVDELRTGASSDVLKLRHSVNQQMTAAFGERGYSTWGQVVANLSSGWLLKNRDWFLA